MPTRRQSPNIWPGFVDGISTLLLVLVFLLAIFVLSEFVLGLLLKGRDEELQSLTSQMNALTQQLAEEETQNAALTQNVHELTQSLSEIQDADQ